MSYADQLEAILKRAAGTDPIVAKAIRTAAVEERSLRLTNTPEADIARAPEVSKAIATALDHVQGAKPASGLFDTALAKSREQTIKSGGKGIDGTIRRGLETIERATANVAKFRANRRS